MRQFSDKTFFQVIRIREEIVISCDTLVDAIEQKHLFEDKERDNRFMIREVGL